MSNQTGFDYEVMISRLHGGLCAFQSLRAHRRERAQATASPPTTEPRRTPEPPLNVDLLGVMTASAGPPTPTVEEPRSPIPASATSTLRLPPPTPPPRLGLILGGRPVPTEPAPEPPPTGVTQAPSLQAPPTAAQAQEAPRLAPIAALLDARAQEDAQRLERAQAEHRAATTTLLREHRAELRAQSEADAARTTALLREVFAEHRAELRAQSEADAARTTALLRDVFAEHRAELAQANQAHADPLAQAQRPPSADPAAAAGDTASLHTALLEQASIQREANEAVAENIDALTSIVADLGHTVGMLAVAATQKTQQSHGPTGAIFTPPPRVEQATAHAAARHLDPAPTATSTSPHVEPAPASSNETPAAANQPTRTFTVVPLADAITSEPPKPRAIVLTLADEAAERKRVEGVLDDDDDDGNLETKFAIDDDDPARPRLQPCTDIVGTAGEPGDD